MKGTSPQSFSFVHYRKIYPCFILFPRTVPQVMTTSAVEGSLKDRFYALPDNREWDEAYPCLVDGCSNYFFKPAVWRLVLLSPGRGSNYEWLLIPIGSIKIVISDRISVALRVVFSMEKVL